MTMDPQNLDQDIAEAERALKELIEKRDAAIQAQKGETIAKIVAMMQESGITLKDLKDQDLPKAARGTNKKNASETASNKPKKIVAPKYEHPTTGALWTGRGNRRADFKDMTDEELQACLIKQQDEKTGEADQSKQGKSPEELARLRKQYGKK